LDELPAGDVHADGVVQDGHAEEKQARALVHRNNISALFDS
jgi:hypothetical protein